MKAAALLPACAGSDHDVAAAPRASEKHSGETHWCAALEVGPLQVALNRERLATVLSRALAEVPERHKAFELRAEQAEYARAYLMVSPRGPCATASERLMQSQLIVAALYCHRQHTLQFNCFPQELALPEPWAPARRPCLAHPGLQANGTAVLLLRGLPCMCPPSPHQA